MIDWLTLIIQTAFIVTVTIVIRSNAKDISELQSHVEVLRSQVRILAAHAAHQIRNEED